MKKEKERKGKNGEQKVEKCRIECIQPYGNHALICLENVPQPKDEVQIKKREDWSNTPT